MYTKIDTEDCINRLSDFLWDAHTNMTFPHYRPSTLLSAIALVMRNNRMRFGDIFVRQLTGIAMGMSPAPTIANLFVAIHEAAEILQFLDTCLLLLRRFIDDGFGIWLHHHDPAVDKLRWESFQAAVNNGGLRWIFTERSTTVDFMDMTISLSGSKIDTTLYCKPLALHLYIPPHSCHAPGVLTGLIFGEVLRICTLCSRTDDQDAKLKAFFGHVSDRGYPDEQIIPLFSRALENATKYLARTDYEKRRLAEKKKTQARRQVFLHLPYHSGDPTSKTIQKLWRSIVSHPDGKTPLNRLSCNGGGPLPIDKLTIAYSRAPNLGNKLSYRKIDKRSGPKVSSYL
ncbi:hypothetical protein ACHAWF_001948 [Thalassiosira exigua]